MLKIRKKVRREESNGNWSREGGVIIVVQEREKGRRLGLRACALHPIT